MQSIQGYYDIPKAIFYLLKGDHKLAKDQQKVVLAIAAVAAPG